MGGLRDALPHPGIFAFKPLPPSFGQYQACDMVEANKLYREQQVLVFARYCVD